MVSVPIVGMAVTGAEAEAVMVVLRALFEVDPPTLFDDPDFLPSEELLRKRVRYLHAAAEGALRREQYTPREVVPLTQAELLKARLRIELPRSKPPNDR